MKKIIVTLFLINVTFVVSAGQIYPGMISDFESGETHGWKKGQESKAQPSVEIEENGNRYLRVESYGDRVNGTDAKDPDSKLTFFNDSTWTRDYKTLGIVAVKADIQNMLAEPIYITINLLDEIGNFCKSIAPIEIAANSNWQELTFGIRPADLICLSQGSVPIPLDSVDSIFEGISYVYFFSTKDPLKSVAKSIGLIGVDNIVATIEQNLKFFEGSSNDKRPEILDLTSDIIVDSKLMTHITDTPALTSTSNGDMQYLIDETNGLLKTLSGSAIELLRPVSVVQTDGVAAGISYTESGYKQLVTHDGRRIIFFSELHHPDRFQDILHEFGLYMQYDEVGNIQILTHENAAENPWYSMRAAFTSSEAANAQPGIDAYEFSDLKGVTAYRQQFKLNGSFYQQDLFAVPADWNSLRAHLKLLEGVESVSMKNDGVLHAIIAGVNYSARMGAQVSPPDDSFSGERTELVPIGDTNGDGFVDFKVVYPNGQSQMLYLLQ